MLVQVFCGGEVALDCLKDRYEGFVGAMSHVCVGFDMY